MFRRIGEMKLSPDLVRQFMRTEEEMLLNREMSRK